MNIVRKLSAEEAAYLAGLIDGEGTVTLTHKQKGAERHLAITISNTEYALLEWARNVVGAGKITNKSVSKKSYLPSFTYQIHSRQALSVLEQVVPFMHGYKRDRSLLALRDYVRLTPRNGKYSAWQLEERNRFVEKLLQIHPVAGRPVH